MPRRRRRWAFTIRRLLFDVVTLAPPNQPTSSAGCPNSGIRDLIDRRRGSTRDVILGGAARAPDVRPFRLRPAAEHYVARKQALVLASAPVCLDRVGRAGG